MKGCLRFLIVVLLIAALASYFVVTKGPALLEDAKTYLDGALERYHRFIGLFSSEGGESQEPPAGEGDGSGGDSGGDHAGDYGDYKPSVPVDTTLEATLRQGLSNMDSKIDLSALSPTKDAVKNAMSAIIYSSPEYFYLRSEYSISSNNRGVQSITVTYNGTKTEIAAKKQVYESKIAEIVAGAPINGTDFDKILYLHDYFITNYTYDNSLTVRDAYTFFVGKTGVCQAYMLALIATARELGIESIPVTSDPMKHAWNLVKIDGRWYHVDLTWDDTVSYPTFTSYRYFLQSDAGLFAIDADKKESDRHREWVAAESATDTKYDHASYRNAQTPIEKDGGVYYVAVPVENQTNTVHGAVLSGTDVTAMSHFCDVVGGYWMAGQSSFYRDCYAGLAVSGGYLYYNSGNTVVRVSLSTPGVTRSVTVSGLMPGESIYGILGVENGTVTYLKSVAPSEAATATATCEIK